MGLAKKRVLVTGGDGFIGGHIVSELIKKGAQVFVPVLAYNSSSIYQKHIKGRVHIEQLDLLNKKRVCDFILSTKPQFIVHLAAQTTVGEALENPTKTIETNVMTTANVLDASRKFGKVEGIIVASSDKAYGKMNKPYREVDSLKGDFPYDVSKSCTDLIASSYFKTYQLPVVITRFGNVYGTWDFHYDRLVPGLCRAIARSETFLIRSNGRYVRDYVHVKDVVSGYLLLLDKMANIVGEAYNFSSLDTFSVLDVVAIAEKALAREIPYEIQNIARGEIIAQHLISSKAKRLGWKPKYRFKNTIKNIYSWYRDYLRQN